MAYDSTVVLDRDAPQSGSKQPRAAQNDDRLSGRLNALGVEFHWQARALQGMWFVSVANAVVGSRSRLTQDDPIDFALQLAKQLVRQTPPSSRWSGVQGGSALHGCQIDPAKTYVLEETHSTRLKSLEELAEIALRQTEDAAQSQRDGAQRPSSRGSAARRRS